MEKNEIENLILKQAYDWWQRHGGGTVNSIFEKTEGVEEKVFSRVADKLEEDNLINGLGEMLCEITGYGILEAEKRGLIDSEKVSHYENIRLEILKAAAEAYEVEGRYGQAESKKIIGENNFDVDEFHDNVRALDELNLIDSSNGWYFRSTELGREQFAKWQQQNSDNRELENISEPRPNEISNHIQTETDSEKAIVVHRHDYDVALSFAGENREYVEAVATELKKLGVRVFYDKFETANLWGKDLYTHLQNVYQKQAKYTVIFISEHYAKKLWTNHERKMAQARAFTESSEYILPARFDDTEIEGITLTTGFIDLREFFPQEFSRLVCEKLGFEVYKGENSYLTEWTKNEGVNIVSSSQEIPAFPTTLPQYRPAEINKDYWDAYFDWKGSIRIGESEGWTEIWNFPHTMNHCSDGVFMIRWRSANPDVHIATTTSYSVENASDGKTGQFGYMYGTNCEQPLFKFVNTLNGNESNLVDIYYELKFWQAAP